jgi:hypothetical protein
MRYLDKLLSFAREAAQQVGPYLALEILLPGGTIFALLLFLYRRRVAKARALGQPARSGEVAVLPWAGWGRALAGLDQSVRRYIGGDFTTETAAQ